MPIHKINLRDTVILHVDYRDMTEQGMIAQVDAVKRILQEGNVPMLIMSEYNKKNHGYPLFMRKLQDVTTEILPLIKRSAIVADVNVPQRLMLKAYNFFFKRNIKAFLTRDEAIAYLTDDSKTDYDTPEYWKQP